MTPNEDLMSFLASATRHTSVNMEILAERTREEIQQQEEEERAQREELRRLQQQQIQQAASTVQTNTASTTTTTPISTYQDIINMLDVRVDAAEPYTVEDVTPAEPPIPANERPVAVPAYSEIREELVRFSDAEWFRKVQEKTIILAGVGGIGSNMAVILAKLNPSSIYIFDADFVDASNLAGQFYSNDDIGKAKVDALAASVAKYTNYSSIFAINRRYERGEEIIADIMICGFDNMRSRNQYFHTWKDHVLSLPEERRKDCLFMDGRLTADEFQIFCMTGEDSYYMRDYENNYLFSDWEATAERCSFKQTGFLADMIGAYMVNLLVNFCANQVNPRRNMALPFRTSYKSDMMFLDLRR